MSLMKDGFAGTMQHPDEEPHNDVDGLGLQYVLSKPPPKYGTCCWAKYCPGLFAEMSPTTANTPTCETSRRASDSAVAGSCLSSASSSYLILMPLISFVSLKRWIRARAPNSPPGSWPLIPSPATVIVLPSKPRTDGAAPEDVAVTSATLNSASAANRAPARRRPVILECIGFPPIPNPLRAPALSNAGLVP